MIRSIERLSQTIGSVRKNEYWVLSVDEYKLMIFQLLGLLSVIIFLKLHVLKKYLALLYNCR